MSTVNLPSVVQAMSGKLVASSNAAADAFLTEAGDAHKAAPGMPLIRIDHKNGRFTINGEPEEELQGYLILYRQARAYWSKAYKAGESTPPSCASANMLYPTDGDDMQADSCDGCPKAAWGSAKDDRGQACAVQTFALILNPQFGTPPVACLIFPPSSIKSMVGTPRSPGYLSRAEQFRNSQGQPAKFYPLVWSRFLAVQASDIHSVIEAEPLAVCEDPEEAKGIAAAVKFYKAGLDELAGRVGEVARQEDVDTIEV